MRSKSAFLCQPFLFGVCFRHSLNKASLDRFPGFPHWQCNRGLWSDRVQPGFTRWSSALNGHMWRRSSIYYIAILVTHYVVPPCFFVLVIFSLFVLLMHYNYHDASIGCCSPVWHCGGTYSGPSGYQLEGRANPLCWGSFLAVSEPARLQWPRGICSLYFVIHFVKFLAAYHITFAESAC